MRIYGLQWESPLGMLCLLADEERLTHLYLPEHKGAMIPVYAEGEGHPVLALAREQLGEYFGGERTAFDVPILLQGTEFQRQVWEALQTIPFAETWTYRVLATTIHRPSAVRAVGAANGRNPISIIVPCHRVIGANGGLTGYAGGIARKQWLLAHEQKVQQASGRPAHMSSQ